ncbi:uncharacterized protein LOC135495939 isoform X2 [Lineus longissimus]|uniref:uncharacterized protein LOC135495939 isoform X2 n=1 Tax=Lineus longissimus TaxID=88925 RepID=UPI002B4E8486
MASALELITKAFPDGYTEIRNARTYDRFYGKDRLRLWVTWTDLNGQFHDFRFQADNRGIVRFQDRGRVYNSSFPCGSGGVRFTHEGGKEVFAVHPDCEMCMAMFSWMRSMSFSPHATGIEFRCFKKNERGL